jgi:hypothetical protein
MRTLPFSLLICFFSDASQISDISNFPYTINVQLCPNNESTIDVFDENGKLDFYYKT